MATALATKPVEESRYHEMVASLFSIPFLFGVVGHRERPDFVYGSDETGVPLLYRWDATSGAGRLLTPTDDPITGPVALHASEPRVAFARDTGGNEDYAIFVADFGGSIQRITPGSLGRVMHLFWAGDDSWVVVGNDQQSAYVRLVARDGSVRDLFTTDEQLLTAAYDDRRGLAVVSVGRGAGTRLAIVDAATAQVRHWISESEQSEETLPGIYPDLGYLAYATDVPGTHQELVVRSIETLDEIGRFPAPGEFDWIAGKIEWQDAHTVLAVMTKEGRLALQTLDLRSGAWSEPLHEGSVWDASATAHGPVWVSTSFSQPPQVQGLRDGSVATLIAPPQAGQAVAVENHWYSSFDGRQVQGWLIKSSNAGAPLVVYCHGGPTAMTGNWWDPTILALVLAGYHVFAPNVRGSIGFGAEFKRLNIGDLGGGDLQDVLWGARYAVGHLGCDEKPAIVGGSYGGYLVLQALTTQPDDWAGGVAFVPISDHEEDYRRADAHYRFYLQYFFGGTPEDKPELYRDRSPITHVQRLKAPLLILHGENDPRCPIEPVRRFVDVAQEHKLPVQLIVTEDEGHGASRNVNAIGDTVRALEHLLAVYD